MHDTIELPATTETKLSAPDARDSKLAAALRWAERGFHVFPLVPDGKEPLPGSKGHLWATRDEAEIRRLWTDPLGFQQPFNIGCRPDSGTVVIDLDEKDGRNGRANYEALGGVVGGLVVQTPTGGYHVYCRGENVRTGAGKLALGVDTRGPDGYVVAPGSSINGVEYRIVQDDPPLPVPQFVLDRVGTRGERTLARTVYVENDLEANLERARQLAKTAEPAVTGCWHDLGFKLGCKMARLAVAPDTALALLEEFWVPRGSGFASRDRFVRDVLGGYEGAMPEHGRDAALPPSEVFAGVVGPPPPDEVVSDSATAKRRLRLLSVDDCASAEPRRYVVKGLIAAGDVGVVLGGPGVGKSAFTPLLAYAVARGVTVFGRRTRKGGVLYVPSEDPHGLKGRVHALKVRHGDAPDFYVVDGVTDLVNADGQASELVALVTAQQPALLIVDTIAASFPGMKENESEDMSKVIRLARRLARQADGQRGPAVLLLHHTPKSQETTPRGHGSLAGDADVIILLNKDPETNIVSATLTKNRNGPSFNVNMAFTIESEVVGTDEDNDIITAAVAVEADPRLMQRMERLTQAEIMALSILDDLVESGDYEVRRDMSGNWEGLSLSGLVGIPEETWADACDTRRLSTAAQPASRKRKFKRTFEGLLRKGAVKAAGGLVWVVPDREA